MFDPAGRTGFKAKRIRRFVVWFAITFFISLLYPIASFVAAGPAVDAARWLVHTPTFGLYHHTVLPFAVGFFAAMAENVFDIAGKHRMIYRVAIALLLVTLAVFAAFGLIKDATSGWLKPPYLPDGVRQAVYNFERTARQPDLVRTPAGEGLAIDGITLAGYKALLGLTGSKNMKSRDGNLLARVSIAINCVFGLFVAIYAWYVIVILIRRVLKAGPGKEVTGPVICVCAGLWFPCRIYADWYEKSFLDVGWQGNYAPIVLMFVCFIFGVAMLIVSRTGNSLALWVAALVAATLLFTDVLTPLHIGLIALFILIPLGLLAMKTIVEIAEMDEESR